MLKSNLTNLKIVNTVNIGMKIILRHKKRSPVYGLERQRYSILYLNHCGYSGIVQLYRGRPPALNCDPIMNCVTIEVLPS